MRAMVLALVLLVTLGVGGYFYVKSHPGQFAAPAAPAGAAQPAPPPAPVAETCSAQDARYVYRDDPNLTLRLEKAPPGPITATGADSRDYTAVGELLFVVSGYDRNFRFIG